MSRLMCSLCLLICSVTVLAEEPRVAVSNIRRVFHNGEHNAFTDLVKFQDQYFLCFRSCPDGHMVHHTASVIVLRSPDLKSWKQVHQFRVPQRDTRDPHFLVFRDRLLVYTGTWYASDKTIPPAEYDMNLHLGYAVYSDDGTNWQGPQLLEGTFGHYIWRAATDGQKAYLCGRRKREFDVRPKGEGPEVQSMMLESDDGLIWRQRAVFQEENGDETAFLFEPDGRILGIGRRRQPAELLESSPPYTDWKRTELDRHIGGPLLTKWDGKYVVGGRKTLPGQAGPKCSLYWLTGTMLTEFAELPSGGDCSYPGFLELSPQQAVVSWYSSHEEDASGEAITAIYMADLRR